MLNSKDILGSEALAAKEYADHRPDYNGIAALIEGKLTGDELAQTAAHITCCPECSRVFMTAAKEVDQEEGEVSALWGNRTFFALAASLLICIAGTGLWQSGIFVPNTPAPSVYQVMTASIFLDSELEAALQQGGESGFGEQAKEHLSRLLVDRGVQLAAFDRIELNSSLLVRQKSIFRKPEELQMRLENGVLHLKVVESKEENKDNDIELLFSPPPEE